jgi:hypothetical protein
MKQIWIAAIDVSKLGTGADPSYPAFRVPFTDLTENCHRPFWAVDALRPTGDAGAPGGDSGAAGDASSADAASSDAGAGDAAACIPFGADCSSGLCCSGLVCFDNGTGVFTCNTP